MNKKAYCLTEVEQETDAHRWSDACLGLSTEAIADGAVKCKQRVEPWRKMKICNAYQYISTHIAAIKTAGSTREKTNLSYELKRVRRGLFDIECMLSVCNLVPHLSVIDCRLITRTWSITEQPLLCIKTWCWLKGIFAWTSHLVKIVVREPYSYKFVRSYVGCVCEPW